MASACGFRRPYSCGAAGAFPERLKDKGQRMNSSFILCPLPLSFAKSPLSLDPSAADYRPFLTSSSHPSVVCSIRREIVLLLWRAWDTKHSTGLSPGSHRLFGLWGKDCRTFLSLPERPVEKCSRQVSWLRLQPTRRAFPSLG